MRVYFLKILFVLKLLLLICKCFLLMCLMLFFYVLKLIILLCIYYNRDILKLILDDLKFNYSENLLVDCIKFFNKIFMF